MKVYKTIVNKFDQCRNNYHHDKLQNFKKKIKTSSSNNKSPSKSFFFHNFQARWRRHFPGIQLVRCCSKILTFI